MQATEKLRDSTHDLHEVLDQLPLMGKMMSPGVVVSDYANVVERLATCFAIVENQIGNDFHFLKKWNYEPKLPLLLKDLESLHSRAPGLDQSSNGLPKTDHAKVGMIYVLQGSSLGGRFIAKHIASYLKLDADQGLAFYLSSNRVQEMWRDFKNSVNENYSTDTPEFNEMVAGARSAFAVFIEVFRREMTP